jgi:uncharacterized protein DUF4124
MKSPRAVTVALALSFAGAGMAQLLSAEDIYKWTDDQGRVHYSNRGSGASADSASGETSSGGQGWESVLERQKGTEDFQEKADATINNLELKMTRKKRERTRALDELQATQAEITRATNPRPTDLPALKEREATQIGELRKLDFELGAMQTDIAKIRAMKAVEKEPK